LFLVPGRSHVIALRGSYNDGCRRQHFRWSLAKTLSRLTRHKVVHIHVMKEKRRSTHAEGTYDSEEYIALEGVKLQREHANSE
jgi:hypothetical protein